MSKLFIIGTFFLAHVLFYDIFWALVFATIALSLEVMFGRYMQNEK